MLPCGKHSKLAGFTYLTSYENINAEDNTKIMALTNFENKYPDNLTSQELSSIHLDTSYRTYLLKECKTRSMLSFIIEGIQMAMVHDRAKNIMPVMALMSVLDQLGICYNNTEKDEPKFKNGIKRALYYFGDIDEDDDIIKVLYALRNGLLHNISLISKNQYETNENYYFRYNKDIAGVFENAEISWTGDYSNLDMDKNATLINTKNLKLLVDKCLHRASGLNNANKLHVRLAGGLEELFYCYLRTIPE